MTRIRPLSRGQQLLLQRLLASHVMTDYDLRDLYDSIKMSVGEDNRRGLGDMGRSLERCLGVINASLGPAFGLEVRTVALGGRAVPRVGVGREGVDGGPSSDPGPLDPTSGSPTRYHAVVNKISDDPAKSSVHHGPNARSPHEIELLKVILEKIVERCIESEEDEAPSGGGRAGTTGTAGAGCDAALRRMECINLRTELGGAHKGKVGVGEAERAISAFVAEGWLIATRVRPLSLVTTATPRAAAAAASQGPSQDGGDGAEEGDASQDQALASSSVSSRLRKRAKRSIDGLGVMDGDEDDDHDDEDGDDRVGVKRSKRSYSMSHKGSYIMIGPRTYMELPETLTDFGLRRDRMPQFILHGSG